MWEISPEDQVGPENLLWTEDLPVGSDSGYKLCSRSLEDGFRAVWKDWPFKLPR